MKLDPGLNRAAGAGAGRKNPQEDPTLLIELPPGALPLHVNANGTLVVGGFREGGGFYWMPTTGVISLGGDGAVESSRDGRTIVGNASDARRVRQAGIWQRAAEWKLLGSIAANAAPCDDLLSSTFGTSADGRVIVGLAWNGCNIARAFRWEEATGMVDLGSTVAGRSSRANGVSGDGKVVIGWQEHETGPRMGARWVDGRQEVFAGPDGFVGEAHGANSDASIVVGQTCRFTGTLDQSAWIWTAREGVQCVLPRAEARGAIGIMFDQRGWRRDRRGAQLRPRIRRGALDRSFAVVREGLSADARGADGVRRVDQHRVHHGRLSGWSHPCRLRRRTERLSRVTS